MQDIKMQDMKMPEITGAFNCVVFFSFLILSKLAALGFCC